MLLEQYNIDIDQYRSMSKSMLFWDRWMPI